jgi:[ribosomal protein S18]-alanine N-acetyltransferase
MKNSDLTLRLARAADAKAIANMSRELIETGLGWRWTEQRVVANITNDNTNVLVARLDNRLAGFGIMKYGDRVAHLNLFAVAPDCRRTGIGRQLLRWLERCATVAGNVAVSLEVRASNTGAQRFYESMGYRTLVQLPGYYQGVEPALRMGRRLTANIT